MTRGAKFLTCGVVLAVAGCASQGELTIRPTAARPADAKAVPFGVAEAQAQFALGNVAMALESYRKALRQHPRSVEAMAGIAACYDRMGRFDLSRRHYEAALAVDPGNMIVLAALAASLDMQGRAVDAAAVRDEMRQRLASGTPVAPVAPPEVDTAELERIAVAEAEPDLQSSPLQARVATPLMTAVAVMPVEQAAVAPAAARSVTITLPPARPAADPPEIDTAELKRITGARAEPQFSASPLRTNDSAPLMTAVAVMPVEPEQAAPAKAPEPAPIAVAARSVTIALPPARPADQARTPSAPRAERAPRRAEASIGKGPRLERLSLGEVALVTRSGPQWRPQLVDNGPRSATVRFVPLRQAQTRTASIRLLNAARVQGLAASTRSILVGRGWRGLAIGDAPAVRARSVVLYPAGSRIMAQRLARQFGFAAEQRASGRGITLLLGRDAAALARKRSAA